MIITYFNTYSRSFWVKVAAPFLPSKKSSLILSCPICVRASCTNRTSRIWKLTSYNHKPKTILLHNKLANERSLDPSITFANSDWLRAAASFLACFFASFSETAAILRNCLHKSLANSSVCITSSYLATAVFWSAFRSFPELCKAL